jgi:hypothetical protein
MSKWGEREASMFVHVRRSVVVTWGVFVDRCECL